MHVTVESTGTLERRMRVELPIAPIEQQVDSRLKSVGRTAKTKGCLSRKTALAMTHQLMLSAKKKWRKLDGQNRLPEIIQGIEFRDGIKHETKAA